MSTHTPTPSSSPANPRLVNALVPYAHVADVAASINFYALLGLRPQFTHAAPDGTVVWAKVTAPDSPAPVSIMLACASGPIEHGHQAVLFYLHTSSVAAVRTALAAAGVPEAHTTPDTPETAPDAIRRWGGGRASIGPLNHPFYMPAGELRLTDPDGYVLLVGQL